MAVATVFVACNNEEKTTTDETKTDTVTAPAPTAPVDTLPKVDTAAKADTSVAK